MALDTHLCDAVQMVYKTVALFVVSVRKIKFHFQMPANSTLKRGVRSRCISCCMSIWISQRKTNTRWHLFIIIMITMIIIIIIIITIIIIYFFILCWKHQCINSQNAIVIDMRKKWKQIEKIIYSKNQIKKFTPPK